MKLGFYQLDLIVANVQMDEVDKCTSVYQNQLVDKWMKLGFYHLEVELGLCKSFIRAALF